MAEVKEKSGEARRGDGVLLVVQDNGSRSLTIRNANESISNLLGYTYGDLTDHALLEILGERTANIIKEEIEFKDDSPDFGDIFTRQPSLRLRHRLGQELVVPCTVMRMMAEDKHAKFQLVLPDEREKREKEQVREFLKTNLEGRQTLDPKLKLPDRESTLRYIDLLKSYLATKDMTACFAVLRLDRYERSLARYGIENCYAQLQHAANHCRSTFRSEDVVSVVSESALGLILLDISRESARLVLNRLRWNVRNHRIELGGKSDFSVTVSVVFDMITNQRAEDLLHACEKAIEELGTDERNALIELDT